MEENMNRTEQQEDGGTKRTIFDKQSKKYLLVTTFGVVLFVALNNLGSVGAAISFVLSVVKPFAIGAVIAFLLNLQMRFIERKLLFRFRKKRGLSIFLTYLTAFAGITVLLSQIVPQLFNSMLALYGNIPVYLDNLNGFTELLVGDFGVSQSTIDAVYQMVSGFTSSSLSWLQESLPSLLREIAAAVGSGFFIGFTSLIASVYMLANKEKLITQCKRVLYATMPEKICGKAMRIARLSNSIFSGFLSGKLLVSLVLGIVCFVFMSIFNIFHSITGIGWLQMPYALLISTLIGITNIIPYFGPWIGTVPSVFVLLMVSPISALLFLAFIIILQQIDNNFITPKLIGKSTGLPALWVFVGTIVGGRLWGITGMLIGVPVAAVLYILSSDFVENQLQKRGLDKSIPRFQSIVKISAKKTMKQVPDTDNKEETTP